MINLKYDIIKIIIYSKLNSKFINYIFYCYLFYNILNIFNQTLKKKNKFKYK
jgi:hypothetical protein